MGRTAGKLEDLDGILNALKFGNFLPNSSCFPDQSYHGAFEDLGRLQKVKSGSFKEVEPSTLKFRVYPDFDPRPFLDETSLGIYERPFDFAIRPEGCEGRVPRVRVHCSRAERVKLYSPLDASRRIRLFPPDVVRKDYASGVLAVLKSLEADRIMLDSRPHNLLEALPGRFIRSLGAGETLTQLCLEKGEKQLKRRERFLPPLQRISPKVLAERAHRDHQSERGRRFQLFPFM